MIYHCEAVDVATPERNGIIHRAAEPIIREELHLRGLGPISIGGVWDKAIELVIIVSNIFHVQGRLHRRFIGLGAQPNNYGFREAGIQFFHRAVEHPESKAINAITQDWAIPFLHPGGHFIYEHGIIREELRGIPSIPIYPHLAGGGNIHRIYPCEVQNVIG